MKFQTPIDALLIYCRIQAVYLSTQLRIFTKYAFRKFLQVFFAKA